jgi:hypothetical protein
LRLRSVIKRNFKRKRWLHWPTMPLNGRQHSKMKLTK